jgi:N-acetylmuramoyl-L-alanine amidase
VNDRRFLGLLALVCLLPVFLAAQAQQAPQPTPPPAPPPGTTAPRQPSVVLDGAPLPAPVTINPSGPLFGLTALVNNLGGQLADGGEESVSLTIEGKEVVIGIGSAIVTVGDGLVSLSQPPVRGEGTLMVPLDFLQKTYGDLAGYAFEWRPALQQLAISRQAAREIPVLLDVVHLQGMTTVVLQFQEIPRYQVQRQAGLVQVQMMGDRLAPPPVPPAVTDPLVQGVTVGAEQISLQLVPGAQASSYVLENPFRLVFDVHMPSQTPAPGATATLRPAERPAGINTIVIDPGHGGTETGAIGPSGVQEKELTLTIARELEASLESRLGIRVVLTRNEDANVPHDARTAIANQNQADLFISVHLNSSLGAGAHGAETYFLSADASDARAARRAEAENAEDRSTGEAMTSGMDPDLELILWDLAQTHHLLESQRFAAMIQGELNQTLQLRDRGVKQAPFRVLNGAAMPAVLVELGFVSNPDEEKKLQDGAYRAELIASLTRAISRYKSLVEKKPDPLADQPAQPGQQTPAQPGAAQPSRPAQPGAATPAPGAPGTRPPGTR